MFSKLPLPILGIFMILPLHQTAGKDCLMFDVGVITYKDITVVRPAF